MKPNLKNWTFSFLIFSIILFGQGCLSRSVPMGVGDLDWGVEVTWHGHSCFSFRDSLNRVIVTDPFDSTVGYGRLTLKADALLVTHSHFDHIAISRVKSKRLNVDLVNSTGTVSVAGDLNVKGISSFHDDANGNHHGDNRIYVFEMAGLKFAHLGDLGQKKLSPFQISEIGSVDVLLIPVGGFTTIGPVRAKKIVDVLNPKIVFPMHYGNIRFYRLAEVEEFTKLFDPSQIRKNNQSHVRIRLTDLPKKPQIMTLKPIDRNY